MDSFKPEFLIGPSVPFKGINTSAPGCHLPMGKMQIANNLRTVQGCVTVRKPCVSSAFGIAGSGTFRGFFECTFDSVVTFFCAIAAASVVKIYKSVNFGVSWSEITAASGAYGNTRLTDTGGIVEFQNFQDRAPFGLTQYDCLFIQNGVDTPRLYGKGSILGGVSASAYTTVTLVQPDVPQNASYSKGLDHFLHINTPAFAAYTSVAGMTLADGSALAGYNYVSITMDNTYVAGTFGIVDFTATPLVLSRGNVVWVTLSLLTDAFFDNLKIEIDDGTGKWTTVYDPTSPNADSVEIGMAGTSSIIQYGASIKAQAVVTGINLASIKKIRFSRATVPAGTITGFLLVFGEQGYVPGSTEYAMAFSQANGRGTGVATVGEEFPVDLTTMGGSASWPVKPSNSPVYGWDYNIRTDNSTLFASGVDRLYVYRLEPGDDDFYLLGSKLISTYSGSWAVVNALGAFFTDDAGAQEDLSRPALDSAYVIIPIGLPMCATVSRVMLGQPQRFWYSGADRPTEFRIFVDDLPDGSLDPASPGSFGIDGETPKQLVAIGQTGAGNEDTGSSPIGLATVFILTDRTVTWITGWDSTSLNKRNALYERGTLSPKSAGKTRTGFYFLDSDFQMCGVNGFQVEQISRDVVDVTLQALTASDASRTWGVQRNGRYYLLFGSTSNTNCMIYDAHESQRLGEHVFLQDVFPVAVHGVSALIAVGSGAQTRLIGMDSTGQGLEHEALTGSSDQGVSGVTWSITFPEVHLGLWQALRVGKMGVVADNQIGTLSTGRFIQGRQVFTPTTPAYLGTITPSTNGNRIVQWDKASNGNPPGSPGGSSIYLTLGGASPSGQRIFAAIIEVGPDQAEGPKVS